MMLNLSGTLQLIPRLDQKLKLTPQMKQSLHLLNLSAEDLDAFLENALSENPFLEHMRPIGTRVGDDEAEQQRRFDEAASVQSESLEKHLWDQIRFFHWSTIEKELTEEIIGNLNEDGYLPVSLSEIAGTVGASLEKAEEVLLKIQSLDPPGVAARNLKECLLIQLGRFECLPNSPKALAGQIIKNYLEDLKITRYRAIARRLKVSLRRVQCAVHQIRTLNPRPGLNFSNVRPMTKIPDILLHRRGKKYQMINCRQPFTRIRINPAYQKFFKQKKMLSEQEKNFKEQLRSGLWLVKALDRREKTIEKLARCLIKEQREFLDKGPAYLKPLTMEKTARILGLHKSTVSRAGAHKYVKTPHGIFEFKFFFGGGLGGPKNFFSGQSVRSRIQALIMKENKKNPLHDAQIAETLQSQGIEVARRTVAKYRQKLRILPAYIRKEYF